MKIFLLLLSVSVLSTAQRDSVARQLADAERAFSAAAETVGIKESFLQFLSDDCVMFDPYPVKGKELYRSRPASTAFLSWSPAFVEAAASGDLGISTGPWEYRKTKNDTTVAYGHYFSVWKKQQDSMWKVVLDLGISYPKEKKRNESVHCRDLPAKKHGRIVRDTLQSELLDAEQDFIRSMKKHGPQKTYSKYAAQNLRVYRNGSFPSQRKNDALHLLAKDRRQTEFSPAATQMASSGDLGFTYGVSVTAMNDSSSYVRVWRKDKEWKIAVDILETFKK